MVSDFTTQNSDITFFGQTTFRNRHQRFGILRDDRRRHMYIIGKTGMGKTALLENMVIQDIINGEGVAYLDPHGDTAEKLLDYIPANRINDVVYFNPGDLQYPISFNILEKVESEHKHLVASGLMGVFTKIWANLWSARMEYILNNTILALLEVPGNTLLGIMRMLVDKEFRKKIVSNVQDPIVRSFWVDEYANWNERFRTEAIQPIQNKVGQFLSSSIIRNIVGQPKSTLDLRGLMDNQKILIMNLSKGRIGEDASALLGAMMITKLQLAAMSRVDIANEEDRKDFYLYVDEFQNYSTESFANILSEARKYHLNLIMAHQYIAQLSDEVRDAVFGNVGTLINFRVGAEDAEELEKEFSPYILATDIVNLPKYQIYLKLMIDGVASRPFSAQTLPPMHEGQHHGENRSKVINVSRERYAKPKDMVEDKIIRWLNPAEVVKETAVGATLSEEEEAYQHGSFRDKFPQKPAAAPAKPKAAPLKEPNAICDNCTKPTHITFTPDEKRNVFCKDCLKLFKSGAIDVVKLSKKNLKDSAPATDKPQPDVSQRVSKQTAIKKPAEKSWTYPQSAPATVTAPVLVKQPSRISPGQDRPRASQGKSELSSNQAKNSQPRIETELSLNEMLQQKPSSFSRGQKTNKFLQPGEVVRLTG